MKIVHVSAIATAIVIVLGIVLVIPPYLQPRQPLVVLLSFNIENDKNLPQWCSDLSSVLDKYDVKATIFVTGKVADRYSECVTAFSNNVDVGSQTYNYVDLTSIEDYVTQLNEVKNGKIAVDNAGDIDSKLFKAPYGATDENIYSLLSRSDILADFSYKNQYNKYHDGKFIKFNLTAYDGTAHPADFFRGLPVDKPVLINFDNSVSIEKIDDFISKLQSRQILFVDASELTGINLTVKQGGND